MNEKIKDIFFLIYYAGLFIGAGWLFYYGITIIGMMLPK